MVAETLELTSTNDVEVVMRDPDAAGLVNSFFKGSSESIAFLYQSKEVGHGTDQWASSFAVDACYWFPSAATDPAARVSPLLNVTQASKLNIAYVSRRFLLQERIESGDGGVGYAPKVTVMALSDVDTSASGADAGGAGLSAFAAAPSSPTTATAIAVGQPRRAGLATSFTESMGTASYGTGGRTPKALSAPPPLPHALHGQFVSDRLHGTAVYFIRNTDGPLDMSVGVTDDTVSFGLLNTDVLSGFESALSGLVRQGWLWGRRTHVSMQIHICVCACVYVCSHVIVMAWYGILAMVGCSTATSWRAVVTGSCATSTRHGTSLPPCASRRTASATL